MDLHVWSYRGGDVVIYSHFHQNPFSCFGTTGSGGRNLAITITLAVGFYNSLYYRASRATVLPLQTLGLFVLIPHAHRFLLIMAALRSRCGHYIFCPVVSIFYLLLLFFLA